MLIYLVGIELVVRDSTMILAVYIVVISVGQAYSSDRLVVPSNIA